MPIGQGGNASGDVTVLEEGGKYYMCCTGGGMWVSDNLLDWEFHAVEHIPVAPDLVKYKGRFYLTGNTDHVFVADHPLGPYTDLGLFKNTGPVEKGWNGGFDTKIYVDDDGLPYLFWPGRGISGIYGVRLDPDDLTTFAGEPVHLFGFNPMHAWERYGEMNEYPGVAWIEGPWVIKRNGIYYLEYSASGTQWKTYAEGYYTATSPLGPYTYAPNNPLLRKTEGLVTGTAHGSIVQVKDKDEWWQFYTIVLSNPPGGRRIGMDKVTFDADGLMACTVTDTPQAAPGASGRRARLHPRHHQQDERDERPVQVLVPAGRLPGRLRRGQLQRDGVETRRGRSAAVPHHRALPRHALRRRPALHRGRPAGPIQRRRTSVRPAT